MTYVSSLKSLYDQELENEKAYVTMNEDLDIFNLFFQFFKFYLITFLYSYFVDFPMKFLKKGFKNKHKISFESSHSIICLNFKRFLHLLCLKMFILRNVLKMLFCNL